MVRPAVELQATPVESGGEVTANAVTESAGPLPLANDEPLRKASERPSYVTSFFDTRDVEETGGGDTQQAPAPVVAANAVGREATPPAPSPTVINRASVAPEDSSVVAAATASIGREGAGMGFASAVPWKLVLPVAGLAAFGLFLPGIARRKRQRTLKMNNRNLDAPLLAGEGTWEPNHESHRAPWEAPSSTEAGFAHRFRAGSEAAAGLLFVEDIESESAESAATAPRPVTPMLLESVHATVEPVRPGPPLVFAAAQAMDSSAAASVPAERSTSVTAAPTAESHVVNDRLEAIVNAQAAMPEGTANRIAPPSFFNESPAVATRPDERGTGASAKATPSVSVPLVDLQALGILATPGRATESLVAEPAHSAAEPLPAAAPEPTPDIPHASVPTPSADASLEEARALLEAGHPHQALAVLDSVQVPSQASMDALELSACAWSLIARDSGASTAYAGAADALEQLLERDPEHPAGWYRVGHYRLHQAGAERGADQRQTLESAVVAMQRAVDRSERTDPDSLLALGEALAQRAAATPSDEGQERKAAGFAEAAVAFRDAANLLRDPASSGHWNLQEALQAQARASASPDAAKLRMEADGLLAAGLKTVEADQRALWYAAKVENELAHAALAGGATRVLHLRNFRNSYCDVLTGPDATPDMMLSWLELITLEITHLRGDAARARFTEGDAILQRLEAMLPGNPHVAHARARLLRRRAAHAGEGSRANVLTDALQCVVPFVDRAGEPQLRLEAAELMLERAACLPTAQAHDDFIRVDGLVATLLNYGALAVPAMRCHVEAKLGLAQPVDTAVRQRLSEMGLQDVRARQALARLALRDGDARTACEHCEAAARLQIDGRADAPLLQLWEQASRQWASTTPVPSRDAAWQANRQRLRAAS